MPQDTSQRTRAFVLAIFFLSGVSGLVYQVIWVRQFANVFGNTVHSASLVTGVFMAGLGAGSYVLGRLADRSHRSDPAAPLRLYARAELWIAALGFALALALPRLSGLSAAVSSYAPGAHGWSTLSTASWALRYVVAILLIAPPTFLMGGTLTLLIRFLVGSDLSSATARISVLYGANTAGAALGALLTDFAFVPALGIFRTQLVAVAINVAAGACAFALVARAPASAAEPEPRGRATHHDATAARRLLTLTAAAVALSGFAAMGLELLWFRALSIILGELRAVFSLLLAVTLVGIWLGAIAGGWLHARFGRPALLLIGAQCLLATVTLALLGFLDHRLMVRAHVDGLRATFAAAAPWQRVALELWTDLRPIALVVALPSLVMGACFPLANAHVQRTAASVGGRAGLVYLANTAGKVLGCALVGFVMLPALGTQLTALFLAAAAVASTVPLFLSVSVRDTRVASRVFVASTGVACAAFISFLSLPRTQLVRASLPIGDEGGTRRILTYREGLNETLAVVDVPGFFVQLFTNGHTMSSSHPKAQRYMRAFAHLPLLQLEAPDRVLVICFGVGTTVHAASLHPTVKHLEVADLSRDVLEHARWFSRSNANVLADPRVSVFLNDGRHHLLTQAEGSYDLVTLEPPPIAFAGVSALYSREFYELVQSRLKPGGYITQWLPAYQVPEETVRAAVRAFVEVFPQSVLLSGDDNELILMGTTGPSIQLDLEAFERRRRNRLAVAADLERVDLGTSKEVVGTFIASAATMTAASKETPAVTDDRPSLEYSVRSTLGGTRMPRDLFDVAGVEAWCPGCTKKVRGLASYLRLRGTVYASERFLVTGNLVPAPFELPADPESQAAVADSRYLQTMLGGSGAAARRAGEDRLAEGELEGAVVALRNALFHDAQDAEAFELLGHASAGAGDLNGAAFALDRAVRLAPERASARFAFARVLRGLGVADGAIEQYRAGLALDPVDQDAHYELGIVLQATGQREEAERELALMLDLDPRNARANLVLCKRAAARNELEAAWAHCAIAEEGGVEIPADLREAPRLQR